MNHDFQYAVTIEPDGASFLAYIPDVPGANAEGATQAEALENAQDALLSAFAGYVRLRKPFPFPETFSGKAEELVRLPELVQAKVLLHNAMIAQGITKTALGNRLGLDEKQVRRMLDPYTPVRFGSLIEALGKLGRRVILALEPA